MKPHVVRDLRLVSDQRQSDELVKARRCWDDWLAECIPESLYEADGWQPAFELRVVADTTVPLPTGRWEGHGEADDKPTGGWSQWSERGRQHLAARMVGRPGATAPIPDNDWALRAADEAWRRLNERLLGPLLPHPDAAVTTPDNRPWSGVLIVSEPSLGAIWAWRLPPASAKPVAPLQQTILACLHARDLSLQAELGEVDISLAELLSLQVGDVVRFPSGHKEGVPFMLNAQARVAGLAQLGQMDGHLAVRFSQSSAVRS